MEKFKKIQTVSNITNPKTGESVQVIKFQKTGTKREFFTCEVNGKRLVSTMFARLYDAEKLAKVYLNRAK